MLESFTQTLSKGIFGFGGTKETYDLSTYQGQSLSTTDSGFWSSWFAGLNFSDKHVSVKTTLQLSAAMACVRLISETLSTLPFVFTEKSSDGSSILAPQHQIYRLLHDQPNADMSATVFWQCLFASLLLDGNSYAEKRYNKSRTTITSIDFLLPQFVTRRMLESGGYLWYYNDPILRKTRQIDERDMWHIPAFTLDGICGISPIRYGANVFGGAMAADQASADTFKNTMRSPGLITMDSVLQPAQREDIRNHVKKISQSGGYMVLEKGASFSQLSMLPEDAELLATRAWNVEEICRWYRVQPALVGHGGKDSNWGTGLEEKMSWLVTLTLRPWAKRVEDSVRKDLLQPAERTRYAGKFALEGLLRGDSAARASFYSAMVNNGVMTRDECRKLEDLAPMGGNASKLTVQSAMLPIDELGQQQEAVQAQNVLKSWLGLFGRDEK